MSDKTLMNGTNLKRSPGRRRRKLLVELLLTLALLIAAVLYINRAGLKSGLRLEVLVKTDISGEITARLDMGKRTPREVKATGAGDFRKVRFPLPRQSVKNVRLSFGQPPGTVQIKQILVKGWFGSYSFKGKRLSTLFSRKQGIKRTYLRKGCYCLEIAGPLHWVAPGRAFYQAVNRLQQDKTFFYILAVLIALLFFYLLHFLDFRRLGAAVRLKPRLGAAGTVMAAVFLLVIFFPLLFHTVNRSGGTGLVEKRKMAVKPEFGWDTLFPYLNRYTSYYNDHFPLRGPLIYWNNFIKVKLFEVSPVAKVLIGKKGWLFFDKFDNQPGTVDYYRSVTLFTPAELERWKNRLEHRYHWLAARGIHYLFVIAPNKNTIYPEFMPDRIRKVHRRSRMDQLLDYLKKHSEVPFLDLRPALLEARQQRPVYPRTDTHWNDFGAYIAHREIMKVISPYFREAQPLPLSRFKIKTVNHMGGDLAIMLSLQDIVLREDIIKLEANPPLAATGKRLKNISRFVRQGVSLCQSAPLPNILMVHDSFYNRLQPFLSEQFSRVLYIWDWDMKFYPKIIEKEKPKLVIDETAERFLLDKSD